MNQFTSTDAPRRAQKLSISWQMLTPSDDTADSPEERDEGFWPSRDPESPGYIGENPTPSYGVQFAQAEKRLANFNRGLWEYVGVVARAVVHIPIGGQSFRVMTLDSAGLWGIESDSGDYLRTVYEEQKSDLLAELTTFAGAIANGNFDQEEAE